MRRSLLAPFAALSLVACDKAPTAPGAMAPSESSAEITLAVPASGLDGPGLVHSEIARVTPVLAGEPGSAQLLTALRAFDDLVLEGRSSFSAAQLVVTRIDEVAASVSTTNVLPELDALRLMLESIRFAESSAQSRTGQLRRLAVW